MASLYTPAAQVASSGLPTGKDDNQALLALLTPADWATVSAGVGHQVGLSISSSNPGLQPALAWTIAFDRRANVLGSDQPASVSYLKSMLGAGQDPQFAQQASKAIDYLEAHLSEQDHTLSGRPATRTNVLA